MPRNAKTANDHDPETPGDFLAKLSESLGEQASAPSVSWKDVDQDDLMAGLVAATEGGAALLFSKTSDGGALTLIIYSGKRKRVAYLSSVERATEMLQHLAGS